MAPRRPESAYRTVARDLREAILKNEYPAGVSLPTEVALASTYGLSRHTIRRAFQDLVAEGLVYRIPGRGTFVPNKDEQYIRQFGSVDDLMGLAVDTTLDLVVPLRRRVDVGAAGRLGLGNDSVYEVAFRRLHDGVVFCLTQVSLPPDVGALLADVPDLAKAGSTSQVTVIGLLDSRLDAPISEAEQSITVTCADAEIAATLGVDAGTPLLRIDRLYFNTKRRPVELAVSHFLPDHYSYRVSLKRSLH